MTAFNFSQPFLMKTLLNYLSNENAKRKNDGYGLIGAYALVFLGIAVSHYIRRRSTQANNAALT
jgi:ATP-binding cassette subfamily C (CFTR/MRP) protein 1